MMRADPNRRRFSTRALTARLAEIGGGCVSCKQPIAAATGLEWDHETPLALGGPDTLGNLVPLCRACHRVKTTMDLGRIAKAKRVEAFHSGVKGRRAIIPGSRASGWKKRFSGEVVKRDG